MAESEPAMPGSAAPVLYYHPLSSYCHKLLIAIDELGADVTLQVINPGDPDERAAHAARWPTGKIPLLMDAGQPVPESSIMIEHLQRHHAAPGRQLIPDDAAAALAVRLWDRLFDLYVMTPMQAFTADLLRPEDQRHPASVAQARSALVSAYTFIDQHLQARAGTGQAWACGDAFSLADCAAAPALFYAVAYEPLAPAHGHLAAYVDRLMDRPSVARTVDQARPWFQYFPGRAGLARRFFDPAST